MEIIVGNGNVNSQLVNDGLIGRPVNFVFTVTYGVYRGGGKPDRASVKLIKYRGIASKVVDGKVITCTDVVRIDDNGKELDEGAKEVDIYAHWTHEVVVQ